MNTYIWCEDTGSGFEFWKMIFDTLFDGFVVESKRNNTELCKAVSKLNSDDRYYVLMDYAIDNPDVLRETQRLYSVVKGKNNVAVIKIHSFEFVLLSFQLLENWVFAEEDELKDKRKKLLELKSEFVDLICNGGEAERLSVLKETLGYSKKLNTEHLSAKILFEITRNTGFETTKGKLGECFINDCCDWKTRGEDDICGLDRKRLASNEKIKTIFDYSVLKDSFAKAGL